MRYQSPLVASLGTPGSPLPATGQTGAIFAAPSSGGLFGPIHSLFGPDNDLYFDRGQTLGALRFNGSTGAYIDSIGSHGLADCLGRGMTFDPEGKLYVSDNKGSMDRYDTLGNFLGEIVPPSLRGARGMTSDTNGSLLVGSFVLDSIMRYDRGVEVRLDTVSATPVSVSYTSMPGTAVALTNYVSQSGTVTFKPGQKTQRILSATKDNLVAEANKSFSV